MPSVSVKCSVLVLSACGCKSEHGFLYMVSKSLLETKEITAQQRKMKETSTGKYKLIKGTKKTCFTHVGEK